MSMSVNNDEGRFSFDFGALEQQLEEIEENILKRKNSSSEITNEIERIQARNLRQTPRRDDHYMLGISDIRPMQTGLSNLVSSIWKKFSASFTREYNA